MTCEIWQKLKEDGSCIVQCIASKYIIKAVRGHVIALLYLNLMILMPKKVDSSNNNTINSGVNLDT